MLLLLISDKDTVSDYIIEDLKAAVSIKVIFNQYVFRLPIL